RARREGIVGEHDVAAFPRTDPPHRIADVATELRGRPGLARVREEESFWRCDRGAEIVRLFDEGGVRGAFDDRAHLLGDGTEDVVEDRELDRLADDHVQNSLLKCSVPTASTSPRQP